LLTQINNKIEKKNYSNMAIISMQTMRYINLLDRSASVRTRNCFVYNNTIYFAVPKRSVSKAIGPAALNVKKMQEKLGKRIRIIQEQEGIADAERFVREIVEPVKLKSLEIKDGTFILNAGSQSKAALIGRNRRRLDELSNILRDCFGMELKII
jgi:transcription termination/antitermination protein NusA